MTREQAHSILDLIRDGKGAHITVKQVNDALIRLGDWEGERSLPLHPIHARARVREERELRAAFVQPDM